MYYVVENSTVCENSKNCSLSKNGWIYNSNNNFVLMAIKKDYLPNIFIVFKVHEHFFIFYYFVISTAWIVNGNQIFKK